MTLVAFACSECGHKVRGPDCAISMTLDCPLCETVATAYKHAND